MSTTTGTVAVQYHRSRGVVRLSETDRIIILEEQLRQEVTGFPTSSGQRAALPAGGE